MTLSKLMKQNIYNGKMIRLESKLDGLKITPKNNINYDVEVNSMMLINPSFIEKILKKKIKKKLDYYLQYIISLIDDETDSDPTGLPQALNDLARYKSIVEYKYHKYLDDKYITLLLKKIEVLEHEIKMKMVYKQLAEYEVEEEVKGKSR